jgi:prolyl oligopeptidase
MRLQAVVLGFALLLGSCTTMNASTTAQTDPYLWLEETESPRALAWVEQENARSLGQLQADPRYAGLYADALAIANSHDRLATGAVRDGYVYNFWQDETHVRGIWRRASLASYAAGAPEWDTLLDLDALAQAENANWVYKGADCLEHSTRCMISLSDGGEDAVTSREFDIATRAFAPDGFVLPLAKSNLSWVDANTLLVGTAWADGALTASGYPTSLRLWRRGQALAEAREVLHIQPDEVGAYSGTSEDVDGARYLFATNAHTFFEYEYSIVVDGVARRITLPAKSNIVGVHKGYFIFTLDEAWRGLPQGAVAAYPVQDLTAENPRTQLLYAPGPRESVEQVALTRDAILIAGYENVRGRLLRLAYDGRAWVQSQVQLPPNGSVNVTGASSTESTAFAVFSNFLTPQTLYTLSNRATEARVVRSLHPQFDASRFVAEQFEAASSDGAQIPYFIIRPRDQQTNGQNPTLLYAYGGFLDSQTPYYAGNVGKLWLERGGTYVIANIRGGGEFGPAWHDAGLRTHRQLIYDDFVAVARDLIARGITSPRRLGIEGGSNGGLLMGVTLNQHPELINAAVVQVPLLDMLRYDQIGAGASWVDEYGSPHDPVERRFLEQTSPYQNLRARPDFPLPFFVTSTKDDRVTPVHARKFAARMHELGMPYLYYENTNGGHAAGINPSEDSRRRALEYTYLMERLMD